jgi:hypothetical protein
LYIVRMRALCLVAVVAALGCRSSAPAPPNCGDNIKNGAETDIDCGGGTCAACGTGRGCHQGSDCQSRVCGSDRTCVAASCSDKVRNGGESDVDCGGPDCAGCADGKICYGNNDCASLVCSGTSCATPTCNDGFKNGDETGVDCGGSCPPCTG